LRSVISVMVTVLLALNRRAAPVPAMASVAAPLATRVSGLFRSMADDSVMVPLKVCMEMVSPGPALNTVWRKEPAPLSARLVTVKVDACAVVPSRDIAIAIDAAATGRSAQK